MRSRPTRAFAGRNVLAWAFAALVVVLPSSSLDAQRHDPTSTTVQREEVARLLRVYEVAGAALRAVDDSLATGAGFDTVRAGPLMILVEGGRGHLVQAPAEAARRALERAFGSAITSADPNPLVLRADPPDASADVPSQLKARHAHAITGHIVQHGTTTMVEAMDPTIRRWASGYGTAAFTDAMFPSAFEELATSPSAVARRCLIGELAECREALDLAGTEEPLHRWYDAAQRRAIARDHRWSLRPMAPERFDRCMDGGDAACDTVLVALPREQVPPPLGTNARQSFIRLTVERGGPEAFARLLATRHDPLDRRFARAAGMSANSLLAAWHARVLDARPRRSGFGLPSAASATMWILVFGFLATRSSRWR